MPQLPRRLWWFILSFLVVGVIAAAGLHALTDSERIRNSLRERVSQNWGRQLEIGAVAVRLLPTPSVVASDVRLANAPSARAAHMAQAREVRATLALWPLLRGRTDITHLTIDGLALDLEVLADGTRNWHLQGKASAPWQDALAQLQLETVEVRGGSIGYRDRNAEPVVWGVEHARLVAAPGLQDAALAMRLTRDSHTMLVDATVDDLSRLGVAGATSSGSVKLRAGASTLSISGQLPLDPALRAYQVDAVLDAPALKDAFGFFKLERRLPAPLKASARLQAGDGRLAVHDFLLQLGKSTLSGNGDFVTTDGKTVFDVKLQADRIDMIQTFLDMGQPPLPPKRPGKVLRDRPPLAWPLLAKLAGTEGRLQGGIGQLKLRSGIQVTDARANIRFNGDQMEVKTYAGKLLGGTASGDASIDGARRAVRLNLQLRDTQLGQWMQQTGNKVTLSGGPMRVDANVTASGDAMADLAASMSGPVTIDIGAARIRSSAASQAEQLLVNLIPVFAEKNADAVALSCVGARLNFVSGIARGEGIVGARSDASQVLASGQVDLREQSLDLRGRIRARSGINLGVSAIANQVKVTGPLAKPESNFDEGGALAAIARVGAAIFTGGASMLVTAVWDGANPESDPCQIALSGARKKTVTGTPGKKPRASGR